MPWWLCYCNVASKEVYRCIEKSSLQSRLCVNHAELTISRIGELLLPTLAVSQAAQQGHMSGAWRS